MSLAELSLGGSSRGELSLAELNRAGLVPTDRESVRGVGDGRPDAGRRHAPPGGGHRRQAARERR